MAQHFTPPSPNPPVFKPLPEPEFKYAIVYNKAVASMYPNSQNEEFHAIKYFDTVDDMLDYQSQHPHAILKFIRYQEYTLETKLALKLR